MHSKVSNRKGDLFFVCDKGGDTIYACRISEEGRLELCGGAPHHDIPGSSPRYGVFHPKKPFYFMNHETEPLVNAFRYTSEGELTLIQSVSTVPDDFPFPADGPSGKAAEASDLRISADGSTLYNVLRGVDGVAVFDIDQELGTLALRQLIRIPKEKGQRLQPRGCTLSPDEKFLFVALMGSGSIFCRPLILPAGPFGPQFLHTTASLPRAERNSQWRRPALEDGSRNGYGAPFPWTRQPNARGRSGSLCSETRAC